MKGQVLHSQLAKSWLPKKQKNASTIMLLVVIMLMIEYCKFNNILAHSIIKYEIKWQWLPEVQNLLEAYYLFQAKAGDKWESIMLG